MPERQDFENRAVPCAAQPIQMSPLARRLAPVLLAAVVALTSLSTQAQNDPPQMFRIAAPSVEGYGFTLAGLVASGLSNPPGGRSCEKGGSCGVPGMIAVVQTVAGSDQAAAMVMRGQIEAALLPADALARVLASAGPTTAGDKPNALRTISTLSVAPFQVMMRAKALSSGPGDATPDGPESRRVAVTAEEGESPALAARLAGKLLPSAVVDPASVDITAGITALIEGRVHWLAFMSATPSAAFVEPIRAGQIRPISPDRAAMTAQQAKSAWLINVRIPVGSYPDAPEVETLGLPTQLVVRADLPAETAHALARALWEPATIKLIGPSRDLKIEQATAGLVAPLHIGAARFYRERGVVEEGAQLE
jgi:TRAP transporter TAXI family solute receptor